MTTTAAAHTPHPRIEHRRREHEDAARKVSSFNGWLAVKITDLVGTMWCAYAFAGLALISLPQAIKGGTATLIAWIAQTFLQLVLLSIIMVGQKVAAAASDRQTTQTYKDAEALLEITDDLHRLITINNAMTEEIHTLVAKSKT